MGHMKCVLIVSYMYCHKPLNDSIVHEPFF